MPNVAPSVKVLADCGGKTDDDDAFFNDLSNARPGERKVDESKLFGMEGLAGPPERCEITLSLERGATPPQRFCYRSGETTPGACK